MKLMNGQMDVLRNIKGKNLSQTSAENHKFFEMFSKQVMGKMYVMDWEQS